MSSTKRTLDYDEIAALVAWLAAAPPTLHRILLGMTRGPDGELELIQYSNHGGDWTCTLDDEELLEDGDYAALMEELPRALAEKQVEDEAHWKELAATQGAKEK